MIHGHIAEVVRLRRGPPKSYDSATKKLTEHPLEFPVWRATVYRRDLRLSPIRRLKAELQQFSSAKEPGTLEVLERPASRNQRRITTNHTN